MILSYFKGLLFFNSFMVLQHHNPILDHSVKRLISFNHQIPLIILLEKMLLLHSFSTILILFRIICKKVSHKECMQCLNNAMLTANYDLRRGNFCNVFHSAENGVPHPIKETSFSNLEKSFPFSQGRAVPFFAKQYHHAPKSIFQKYALHPLLPFFI